MFLQFGEVVERIDGVEFTGVDQAHEYVAHSGAVGGFVEVGVLAMEYGFLQGVHRGCCPEGHQVDVGTGSTAPNA